MRPLAEIAHSRGYEVSGSDQTRSANIARLESRGLRIGIGHSAENLPPLPCQIIISSAIKGDNPELLEAQRLNYPILHRSDLLATLMQGKKAICVSGTHGKTSTTAMLAYMLHAMNLAPSAAIGGEILGLEAASFSGDGPYFVAECDESDGTFVKYDPYISIVTNIDLDHLDHHKDINGLKAAFLAFLSKTDPEGSAVLGWDNPLVQEIAQQFHGTRLTFGTRIGSEVRGKNFRNQGRSFQYEAIVERDMIKGTINLVGRHNLQNLLCCLAVARALDLDVAACAKALESYPGVGRRFSLMGEVGSTKIYDDYAHNPGKIRSCIEGAREAFPSDRLLVIFQPHRYSRLETMYNEFMSSFAAADEIFVLPVYAAGETSTHDFSVARLAADLEAASGRKALPYEPSLLAARLSGNQRPTVLVTIGAGDVWRLSLEWKEFLHGQEAQKDQPPRQSKT